MHTSTARLDNINLFLSSAGEIQERKTELSTLKHWSVMRPPGHGPQLDLCPLCHSVLSPHLLQHTHRVCTPSHVTLFWPLSFSSCTSCWSKVDQLYLQTLCYFIVCWSCNCLSHNAYKSKLFRTFTVLTTQVSVSLEVPFFSMTGHGKASIRSTISLPADASTSAPKFIVLSLLESRHKC